MLRTKIAAATLVAAGVIGAATPAFAHECYKKGLAETQAANGQWMTADELRGLIDELPPCADADLLLAAVDEMEAEGGLMMGPGLLAGGTLRNGKENTPSNFGYLPIEEAFAGCGEF
jgi:hypothetical protein